VRRRIAALLHALEKATAPGARPSSAASTRQPILRPVSITQMRCPNVPRLRAAKNRRAPAGALEKTPAVGSAAVLGRMNVTTDPTIRFDPANRATERTPAGCGEESPRSCTRWKKQRRRERGRPRPHQSDNRSYDLFRSSKSGHRTYTGWVRRRIAALLPARWRKHRRSGARPSSAASTRQPILRPVSIMHIGPPNIHRLGAAKNRRAPAGALEKTPAGGSVAVLGRINVTTDPTTRFDHANPAPERSPAGGGQECPRSCRRTGENTGGRERGRPRPHQPDNRFYDPFRSCKSGRRTYTGWVRRGIAALLHALEKATAPGARPSSAASTRQPILRPASIMQILRPNVHRLGAAKNRRAPAGALEKTPAVGSAAVPGRINQTTDPTARFDHANAVPERSPAEGGEESPRSCRRAGENTGGRERGRPRPHQPDNQPYDPFRSRKSGHRTYTGWVRRRIAALLPARWRKHRRSGARPSSAAST